MSENIKSINKLVPYTFIIPDYQRNYRWTEKEVKQLLEDIISGNEGYSLQPIVVKAIEKNKYILIDGQQRLTTLYCILMLVNEKHYEILRDDKKLSTKINTIQGKNINEIDDIDEWHIANACKIINETSSDIQKNIKNFNKAKVIWYEIDENENEEKVFERLNIGKIPLYDAEIKKAVAITELENDNEKEKCAKLWCKIEKDLRNENDIKYCALSNNIQDLTDGTQRISVYLDIIEKQKEESTYYKKLDSCYEKYNNLMNNNKMFNFIGYYISSNIGKAEGILKNDIIEEIKEYISEIDIVNLEYDYNQEDVKRILLLYNILLYNDKEEKFPYDKYKKEVYDIEHINAQKLEYEKLFIVKKNSTNIKEILDTMNDIIKNLKAIKVDINIIKTQKELIAKDGEIEHIYEHPIIQTMTNNISNLTLLLESQNKTLGNKSYQDKCEKLQKKELLYGTKEIFKSSSKMKIWDGSEYLANIIKRLNTFLRKTK